MHVLWNSLIRPAIDAVQPRIIVEIGTEDGKTTKQILESCAKWNAVLHTIDPRPLLDPGEWKKKWGEYFVFHKQKSLEALSDIPFPDVILIDGDHNWYTVFHELKLIERRSKDEKKSFPLLFLHDVGWPYARRDLYYDIEAIPPAYRRPHAVGGVIRGKQELSPHGLNAKHVHATEEGTPQNGVRTAVEDFLKQTDLGLEWMIMPGFHGLGIMAATETLERTPALQSFVQSLSSPEAQTAHMEFLEALRTETLPNEQVLTEYAMSLKEHLAAQEKWAQGKQTELEQALSASQKREDRLYHSKSWRWTAPFRRVGLALRSFRQRS
ncbi:MAG TPA: class I SAM-dependent methyltransferase [Candidatus Peribacteraceae bacterium]|nr:class I SAM-dependent methyltransferase [Candidatus Peribacteraceae bacterium]